MSEVVDRALLLEVGVLLRGLLAELDDAASELVTSRAMHRRIELAVMVLDMVSESPAA